MMLTIPTDERYITDEQVFGALDLSYPGLEKVRAAFSAGDMAEAKKQLVRHMEVRNRPHFFYDYRSLPLAPIDTDSCPYSFQASLGLSGSLKEFCLYAGRKMMDHIYVLPGGGEGREFDLGKNWESMIHFNFLEDQGKKHRNPLDMIVRGQFFEYLSVLYHETGDLKVLDSFEEILNVFFETYPLKIVDGSPSTNRFQYTEDRDVMSAGWLAVVYTGLFYTRIPYEIQTDLAFETLKRIWFLGIQFRRFDEDGYRPYNHHMWERGLVPFILGAMYPEIPDFAAMKAHGAETVCRHIKEDFNVSGGYSEHSIAYWSGAAVGEMLYRGIYLARLNDEVLLDEETRNRMEQTFSILALISPPGERYPSLGDNGGPMTEPVLNLGVRMMEHKECRQVLAARRAAKGTCNGDASFGGQTLAPLDYCNDQAGFVCAKSGYTPDSNYMLMSAKVNCGYCGHNHMDMLSMFLTFHGEEIIGEPYVNLMYHRVRMNSEIRGYMYNMASHNTVLAYGTPILPNRMYANKWGVLRTPSPVTDSFSAKDGFYVNAFHDGYTFCRHQREVLFHRSRGVIISDHILRGNRIEGDHIQRWNMMPGVQVTLLDPDSALVEKRGVKLLFIWPGASHRLSLCKPELLCPEMIPDKEELADIIDVSFHASEEQENQNVTVTLNLMILDLTGTGSGEEGIAGEQTNRQKDGISEERLNWLKDGISEERLNQLKEETQKLAGRLNQPETLEQFPIY